jgi:hypothetical protein
MHARYLVIIPNVVELLVWNSLVNVGRWSMSRKGNCWDNAMVESFFATLRKEEVHRAYYVTHIL